MTQENEGARSNHAVTCVRTSSAAGQSAQCQYPTNRRETVRLSGVNVNVRLVNVRRRRGVPLFPSQSTSV